MNVSWIPQDRAELRSIMAGWEAAGNLVAHPRRVFDEPAHTIQGQPPAVFTAWQVARYPNVGTGFLEDAEAPLRTGAFEVMFWLQPGRGGAVLDDPDTGLYRLFADHLNTYTGALEFLPPTPVGDRQGTGIKGEVWHVEGISFPFKAT